MARVLALIAAFSLIGCVASNPETGQPAPAASLTGIEWKLVEFVSSDDSIGSIRPAEDEDYTMRLNPDGTAAFGLFCNRATGQWHSADEAKAMGSLSIELGAMTRAACPPSRLERISTDLPHVASFVIRDGKLHLNLAMSSGDYVWAPR